MIKHAVHHQYVWLAIVPLALFAFSDALAGAEPDIRRDAVVVATEKVLPSVVNIATETVVEYHDWYDDLLRRFYGASRGPIRQKSISLGSGVIIDEEGYVLTNFHVVRRATRIQVKLWDGREYDAESVVATVGTDVALLKIKAPSSETFKAIKLAPDDDLLLGETVLALGNPFGLGVSVTKGILSSKNRRPSQGNEPLNVEDWLQTDAAINPGNSGGPLVNLRGELIGLNVAVYREDDGERGMGVGFSIPVKQVSTSLSRFFTPEVTDGLWFGAQLKATPQGLIVSHLNGDSPAALAGIRENDRILEVEGKAPRNVVDFNRLLSGASNHEARLVLGRGQERSPVTVRLMPADQMVRQRIGLTLVEVSPRKGQASGLNEAKELFVEDVERNGPAAQAGVERGHYVTGVEGQKVPGLKAFGAALANAKRGDTITVSLQARRRHASGFVELREGAVQLRVR